MAGVFGGEVGVQVTADEGGCAAVGGGEGAVGRDAAGAVMGGIGELEVIGRVNGEVVLLFESAGNAGFKRHKSKSLEFQRDLSSPEGHPEDPCGVCQHGQRYCGHRRGGRI